MYEDICSEPRNDSFEYGYWKHTIVNFLWFMVTISKFQKGERMFHWQSHEANRRNMKGLKLSDIRKTHKP